MIKKILQKAFPHTIAILVFLILNCFYFYPQLQNKKLNAGDLISYLGMTKELNDVREITDEDVLWTNAMFGGMPSFNIGTPRKGNKIKYLEVIGELFFARPIGYFNILMIGFYILLVMLGVNPWMSIIGSVAFGFTTNHFILMEAGHMTKIRAIAYFPIIVAGVIMTFRKELILGGLLFTIGMALNIYANHIQMTYYLGMILFFYVLIEAYSHIKDKKVLDLVKAGAVLLVGLGLAIGSASSILLTTYAHSKETMRGKPILELPDTGEATSSSQVEGLEWSYAMQWSNGSKDLLTSIVPGAMGGSSVRKINQDSKFANEVRKLGSITDRAPLYWGGLPSTAGPVYYGSILCFLFILGLFIVKGKIKWWIVFAVLFTFLLSMGSNFEILNRFLFDHLPMFNKFRAHSSVLGVTGLLIPLLAILAFKQILEGKEKAELLKWLKISVGICLSLLLILAFGSTMFFDFSSPRDALYQQQPGLVEALIQDRKDLLRNDSLRSFGFILVSAGLIWMFIMKKAGKTVVLASIGILILIDLWGVGKRYLDNNSFVLERNYDKLYTPRPVDEQIMNAEPRGRGFYRVFDLSHDTFNSSKSSYFYNTIGGYSAAKLQRYQDLIDYHISKGSLPVLNMLNTKYIIDQDGKVQVNQGALGNAWFVDLVEKVSSPNQEIEVLGSMDPTNVAVALESEFGDYIGSFDPQRGGSITLEEYMPHHLKYKSSAYSGEQFAVFSEIWYGPNKGWQAYIDGEPAEHIRVNYALRGMRIPVGEHEIEFVFKPKVYYLGEKMSLIFSLMILGLLGVYIGKRGYEFYQNRDIESIQKPPVRRVKKRKNKR